MFLLMFSILIYSGKPFCLCYLHSQVDVVQMSKENEGKVKYSKLTTKLILVNANTNTNSRL